MGQNYIFLQRILKTNTCWRRLLVAVKDFSLCKCFLCMKHSHPVFQRIFFGNEETDSQLQNVCFPSLSLSLLTFMDSRYLIASSSQWIKFSLFLFLLQSQIFLGFCFYIPTSYICTDTDPMKKIINLKNVYKSIKLCCKPGRTHFTPAAFGAVGWVWEIRVCAKMTVRQFPPAVLCCRLFQLHVVYLFQVLHRTGGCHQLSS